ncbi:bifunctional riboflavin kinase/FAD synthetase [Flavobacterium algicola]|uniref:bifunctional riboflavin kinase/FAD synthetase n=1 Tax=Flavobacterium algicola TaxID=556529 RepID=UPI001EFE0C66|nr:bifunctional riboflavin kinase/FAD synthetase [Flavobacterium algicola]MCG9791760.1 bifunctional riboflavin kinase/FAD synthetase [Flavobacterium algicola]
MKIFHSIKDFSSNKKTILTLGTFDGVHIGHKKILDKLIQSTQLNEFESLVLTFFPHPRMVLQEKSEIKLLNTIPEKVKLLEAIGIENLVIHPFDESFSRLTAEEFVSSILVDQFRIQKIIIGHDHRFGRNRTADINDLIGFGEKYGFEVEQISVQELNTISVSSTKVRKAIDEGDMQLANNFLGYDYFLTGTVVTGKQLGRTIGFPTANIQISEDYKLIPLNGVYVVKSILQNKIIYGLMNVGFRPTVGGEELSIEVNYLDYEGDLYGQELTVYILKYIRLEQKFESLELLKSQLEVDKAQALSYIEGIE